MNEVHVFCLFFHRPESVFLKGHLYNHLLLKMFNLQKKKTNMAPAQSEFLTTCWLSDLFFGDSFKNTMYNVSNFQLTYNRLFF